MVKTRETGLLGFIRTTDSYDPDRLGQDQEALRKFYTKNGYADFRIVSASADLDRERNVFFVTFAVDEGELYRFGAIDVQTTLPELTPDRLMKVIRSSPGSVYSAEDIEKSMEEIVVEASKNGYAFAQVRARFAMPRPRPSRSPTMSMKVRAPMSSGSMSAATTGRATTSSGASSTLPRATPTTRPSSPAPSAA